MSTSSAAASPAAATPLSAATTAQPPAANPPSSAAVPSALPDPLVGKAVITVSPNLRVRSQPRVAEDSIKFEPLLPEGTALMIVGGPVFASGYAWYLAMPLDLALEGGERMGWVAAADKDGTPWFALRTSDAPSAELAISSVARAPSDPAKAKEAAASINAFGLELYKQMLADGTLNPRTGAVFSPTSIGLALGMARAGAKGTTASQMDAVLHTTGWDKLGPALNALDGALAALNTTGEVPSLDPSTRTVSLRIANASFAQKDWDIEQSYLDQIAATFGAGLRLVDFVADLEAARSTINEWVSDQTERRIPELIPAGLLDKFTRLVLVNAIYMKAGWADGFSVSDTKPRSFTRLDGSRVKVETMFRSGGQGLPYASGPGWRATELQYERRLAMTLIVPDDLSSFEAGLAASDLMRVTARLEQEGRRLGAVTWEGVPADPCGCGCIPYSVNLYLPRFGIDTKAQLGDALRALGMPLALARGEADFSGIHVPQRYEEILYIQGVIHQANIDVDEEGTEAAAATAVYMGDTGGGCVGAPLHPLKVITLRFDRPFLFFVRDVQTGAVLFMGRVVDPSARS